MSDWVHGSSGRVPVLQVQSPEFKLQSYQKKVMEAKVASELIKTLSV
jgi:hypothetical protein